MNQYDQNIYLNDNIQHFYWNKKWILRVYNFSKINSKFYWQNIKKIFQLLFIKK